MGSPWCTFTNFNHILESLLLHAAGFIAPFVLAARLLAHMFTDLRILAALDVLVLTSVAVKLSMTFWLTCPHAGDSQQGEKHAKTHRHCAARRILQHLREGTVWDSDFLWSSLPSTSNLLHRQPPRIADIAVHPSVYSGGSGSSARRLTILYEYLTLSGAPSHRLPQAAGHRSPRRINVCHN